ncbi:hypothetical protein [Phyllobacterium sophorae]|uniref:hypothetical protein n=1 Tax=Phyllobacterium sophorae TaxID=1520277 RepID=UPI001473EC19
MAWNCAGASLGVDLIDDVLVKRDTLHQPDEQRDADAIVEVLTDESDSALASR